MKKLLIAMALLPVLCTTSAADGSERDRFIMANAEMGCFSMSANGQFGTTGEEGDPIVEIAKKHGFTLEELEALGEKYPNSGPDVGMQMQKQCPELMGLINRMGQSGEWNKQQKGDSRSLEHWKK